MGGLILYTTDDGQIVWPTQLEMAEVFVATKQNLSQHLKNLPEDRELDTDSVVKDSLTVRTGNVAQATAEASSAVPVRGRYQGSRHVNIPDHIHKGQFLSECPA